ncbi:hypothetical protein M153_1640007181 [Pseudoloma neurophilia]|uniref:Uncharacterized protein n=1 Tax=Pseudoloma neurophilia TaxID=146866 RepID=A0A0R0M6J1_9MICR|nr:hypothetical protein M153_1640007181 [Pseudoloma neurophilia]
MRLWTMNGEPFDFDGLTSTLEEMKAFIVDYELTISSQQKLALFYYQKGQIQNCLELLEYCLSINLFSTDNSDQIKLALLAFYLDTDTEREEVMTLLTELENTKFKDELQMLKGYYLFSEKKYDTAAFCLENDVAAKNIIYLVKNQPEKVETTDPLLNGYKNYLLGDLEEAIKYFKIEYEKNPKVLAYLLRLAPETFYLNSKYPIDDWTKNTAEFKLLEISRLRKNERLDALSDYYKINPKIKEEFLYEKAKDLHIKEFYEEALEYYTECTSKLADYQCKRILGIKYPGQADLIELDSIKDESQEGHGGPVEEFLHLKKIRKYIDDSAYYNNRAFNLYFIDNITPQIKNEIKLDLNNNKDFSVESIISYLNKALETANPEQKKVIRYNKSVLETPDYEEIDDDLSDAILNIKNDPKSSLEVLLKYLSGKRGTLNSTVNKTIARGIGICLALKGNKFAEHIFKYLKDHTNLQVFYQQMTQNENK